MEDHAGARLQMKEKDHFIEGLEFAGAHGMSGDGMGPQITNGGAWTRRWAGSTPVPPGP